MSVWNPANVQDIAESVGISALNQDVLSALTGDTEFRISQVLEEALRFMRHSRRTILTTQDISLALRALDVEPLYGYESTRPLRFGEASLGPGQPLFYVSDEEVDFEKLINAPLPKVPREITMTAHWLAVEGVQPSIPQNPTNANEVGAQKAGAPELLPRGPGANPYLPALAGMDNPSFKPRVKHVLSSELQLYFTKITNSIYDSENEDYRTAALTSLETDPGLHQLLPYFLQYVAEKVTHNLGDLFTLHMSLQLLSAVLNNKSLFIDPYASSLVPPVLTCAISPRLGPKEGSTTATAPASNGQTAKSLDHYVLRNLAASLLGRIAENFAKSSSTLKPRLVRTCLKYLLDPKKPLSTHYGALRGINQVGGKEAISVLVVPNLKEYAVLLQESLDKGGDDARDAEMMLGAIVEALQKLSPAEILDKPSNGAQLNGATANLDGALQDRLGPLLAARYHQ